MYPEERRVSSDTLFNIYHSAALYSNVEDEGDRVTFMFSDGSSVTLDRSVTVVVNCLERELPEVISKRGWWYVDGAFSGVPETPEAGNKLSKLACVAYDFDFVYIYLSNGSEFRISASAAGALWGFNFSASKNPCLSKSIECGIDGTKISSRVRSNAFAAELCPDISFRGISLHVDGVLQRNGVSTHNYAKPVKYVLTRYDNSTITYEVSLYEEYPTVYIDYKADRIHRTSYIDATMKITDPEHRYWYVDEYESKIQIKGRGNSTWNNFPKKPYHIKLAEKCGVFGMHKNRDFSLLANYSDKSLLRNQVGQKIAAAVGMSWVPESYNVDVYINGDYQGSYDFTEHKEVANHRVDIDVEAGDCYLEIEAKKDNPVWFDT
ncbi:MAG: CotH kinase family protein, partial [Bacteroidales bacterium]|nr:CotH kinase family protein [Bacteroidales bacterium]